MAQTNINIRMDEDLKREFDSLCNELDQTSVKGLEKVKV